MAYKAEAAGSTVPLIAPATRGYYIQTLRQSGQWLDKNLVAEQIPSHILALAPKTVVEQFRLIPLGVDVEDGRQRLVLVTDWPQNIKNIARLEELFKMPVRILLTAAENLAVAMESYYGVANAAVERAPVLNKVVDSDADDRVDEADTSPLVAKADSILWAALNHKASDIHILPHAAGSYVLMRIDGRLLNMSKNHEIGRREKKAIVNIFKNKCDPPMDISSQFQPDGGAFKLEWQGSTVDCRVSTMPTIRGQKVVIRLLAPNQTALDIRKLGFFEADIAAIEKASFIPSGLLLVTGPTGSGKSTTLYSVLKQYGGLANNTITIEDPVEYKDETLTQTQVREAEQEKLSLDARKILKVSLRQDPDIILYGEIRDAEDAAIAIQAAQTGHKVLSTVHAKDCISTLDRLFDMGIRRSSLLGELNCIVSQRLVSLLCPHCAQPYQPGRLDKLFLSAADIAELANGHPLQAGPGCPHCHEGYSGRTVVAEVVLFDNALRDFLRQERGLLDMLEYLRREKGFKTMWEKGLQLVKTGKVDIDSICRVITPNQ